MSRIFKVVLGTAYSTLMFKYLLTLLTDNHETLIEINYLVRSTGDMIKLEKEMKKFLKPNISGLYYVKPERLPTDLKYILKWTDAFGPYSSTDFKNGQEEFIENNCTYHNCFLTKDKTLLLDVRNFDAILFDVENTYDYYPIPRSPHQLYIFVATESSNDYPICHPYFDEHFNITWTYKLDSVIMMPFLTIQDRNNTIVGPKKNMTWKGSMAPIPEEVKKKLATKKKIAAWFVSHCNSKSKRSNVTRHLVWEFAKFGYDIDVYGWCGRLLCPKERLEECLILLEKHYYFYLSFEYSLSDDYITEQLLHPLLNYAVPIVFGGADYSRFLPPGSYINAGENDAKTVAAAVAKAIENPDVYYNYFRWHNYYTYKESPKVPDACTLCKLMNEQTAPRTVKYFRTWWNKDINENCKDFFKRKHNNGREKHKNKD